MKRSFYLLLALLSVLCANAQTKSYKMGETENIIWAYRFDNEYFIVLKHYDTDNFIPYEAVMKIRLLDGSVLKLKATECANSNRLSLAKGAFESNGSFNTIHVYKLPVTKDQIEKIKAGITNLVLNTVPNVEKAKTTTEFGEKLYNDFMTLKDDFEE